MKENNLEKKNINRYSVAFKMKVVEEVENGLITTRGCPEAVRHPR